MKHKIKHIHFVGIGGSGMNGIAEVLLNLGFQVSGSDLVRECRHTTLADTGGDHPLRARHQESARCGCGGDFHSGQGRQPGSGGGTRAAHPDCAPRGDVGRADALASGHRRGGYARQDHHHFVGDQHPGQGRLRSDLCHRRASQQQRCERAFGYG